jgi:MFS family permease
MGFTGIGGPYWATFFPAVVLLGIATSLFVAPLTTTVMNSAPVEHAGSASGINNAVSRVAGLLAIALLGIVIVAASNHAIRNTDRGLPPQVRQVLENRSLLSGRAPERGIPPHWRSEAERAVQSAYVVGFRDAMLACAALAWISALAAFTLLGSRRASYRTAASVTRA